MNITLGKVVESVSVLEKIKNQNPDNFKVKYWIVRNLKILADSYNFFVQSREEIYSKYCHKKQSKTYPQGSYFDISAEGTVLFHLKSNIDVSTFNCEMNELYNLPCDDIQPYVLNIETFDNLHINIEVDDISAIDYLLSE